MNIVDEIWKDVPYYEGYYQVSSLGRVRSLDRVVVHRDGHRRSYAGQLLVPVIGKHGYYRARLNKNSAKTMPLVHKLVAQVKVGSARDRPKKLLFTFALRLFLRKSRPRYRLNRFTRRFFRQQLGSLRSNLSTCLFISHDTLHEV